MTSFDISLLGPFEVRLDGKVIQHFESVKVRALLAYLAAEVDRPQSRGSLAGLLWPDWPDEAAHKNLRHTIYSLRKSLGDDNAASPLIQSDRQFILFKSCNNCTIDTLELERTLAAAQALQIGDGKQQSLIDRLRSIVEPNRGPFLEGFTLDDSPAFEEWILNRREHHNKQILQGLGLLTDWHKQAGEYSQAEKFARRQLALEPWHEEAHRQLMHVLLLSNRRSAALAQFEACRTALRDELGAEPSAFTRQLYQAILNEDLDGLDSLTEIKETPQDEVPSEPGPPPLKGCSTLTSPMQIYSLGEKP